MDNKYVFKFDVNNSNALLVFKDERLHHIIACPPIEKGCDIINFTNKALYGHTYNFDGLILITTPTDRKLYYKGDLIAETIKSPLKTDTSISREPCMIWWDHIDDNESDGFSKWRFGYKYFEKHWLSLTYREIEIIYKCEIIK